MLQDLLDALEEEEDGPTRVWMAWALWRVGFEAENSLAVLIGLAEEARAPGDDNDAPLAAYALSLAGPEAIPALQKMLKEEKDGPRRKIITEALQKLDPKAAAGGESP